MVQSLNTKAILTLASVVRRPSLLIPHVSVRHISEVNYTSLRDQAGIEAVVFDKDHTLTLPYVNSLHAQAAPGLAECQTVFGSERVAILSNSAGTDDDVDGKDADILQETLGIAVIRHSEKKPGGLQSVLDHFGLQDPARVCVVGDRLLTDIVFGNLHGMLTVHTQAFLDDDAQDNWTAKLIRPVENLYMYGRSGESDGLQPIVHKYWPGSVEASLIKERIAVLTKPDSDDESA